MFKTFVVYLKYPSAAGIIGIIWIGSLVLLVAYPTLSVFQVVTLNGAATLLIAYVGFRIDK